MTEPSVNGDAERTHEAKFMEKVKVRMNMPHCVLLSEGRYDELVKEVKSLKISEKYSMNVTWLRAHYDVVTVSSCILQDPVINNIYKLQYEPFPSSGTRS